MMYSCKACGKTLSGDAKERCNVDHSMDDPIMLCSRLFALHSAKSTEIHLVLVSTTSAALSIAAPILPRDQLIALVVNNCILTSFLTFQPWSVLRYSYFPDPFFPLPLPFLHALIDRVAGRSGNQTST